MFFIAKISGWINYCFSWVLEPYPVVGAMLISGSTLFVGLFVTWLWNTKEKKADFFLAFTRRFHEIMEAKYLIETNSTVSEISAKAKI